MQSATTKILGLLFVALFFFACNNGNEPKAEDADTAATATTSSEKAMTLNAQFVEYTLGDASHFIFKDPSGKQWDFGGCEDTTVKFGVELPEAEANESNQGWGANKSLQNKTFDLKYVVKKQALYQDGPIGDVQVIVEAKMVK